MHATTDASESIDMGMINNLPDSVLGWLHEVSQRQGGQTKD
jgi:hypothetical protein